MNRNLLIVGALLAFAGIALVLVLGMVGMVIYKVYMTGPSAPAGSPGDRCVMAGVAAYEAGDYKAAAEHLEKALELGLSENQPEQIYTVLGNAYNQLEEFEKAIAALKKAVELDPDYHSPWNSLGNVHRLLGDFDEAERCYTQALRLKPDYPEGLASYGALYIFRGEPAKAIEKLEQAIRLDPQLPVAHSNIAIAYAMSGRFDDADRSLKLAVAMGYPNGPVIRKRIDELKASAPAEESPAPPAVQK